MKVLARSRRLRNAVLACALCLGCAGSGWAAISDGDIFWHLAAGREMVHTGALIARDPFSVSAAGRIWTDLHWLFQLGAYGVYSLLGLSGLVLVKCALIGLSVWLVHASLPPSARAPSALITLGALLCARHLLLLRPVIVSLVFLALFFTRLERFRRSGQARLLWWLPLCQIVWSNCQGLFALGPALVGAYVVAHAGWLLAGTRPGYPFAAESGARSRAQQRAELRALVLTLVGCLAAGFVTPYGVRALGLPFELLARLIPHHGNPYQAVAENVPPFVLERVSGGEFWHLKWFLLLLAAAIATSGRPVLLSHVLLLSGFVGLALISNRNVLLLYFLAAPIAALQLAPRLRQARRALRGQRWTPWLLSVSLLGLLSVVATAAAREPSLAQPTPFRFPLQSARAIAAHGGHGAVFSADHQGGYLIWKLYPRFRPYIDTRLILRSADEYREYLGLLDNPERFEGFAQRRGFVYAVLPVAYPDRYLPLIAHLYGSERWRLVFTDGAEVLFARGDLVRGTGWDLGQTATVDHILRAMARQYAARRRLRTAARMQLATLEVAIGQYAQAQRVLQPLHAAPAVALSARAHLLAGELGSAEALGRRLLGRDPRDVRSLDLMAQVSIRRGQFLRALGFLHRALQLDPYDGEAMSLVASLEVQHAP